MGVGLKRLLMGGAVAAMATGALAQDRPQIIVVNQALELMAEALVGEAADVVFPVPEGVDPSFWRPSISDISEIQGADLILLNGAGFATWIDRVTLPRARVVNTSAALEDQFIVTQSITHSHGEGEEHSHEGLASYLWLDPTLAVAQADAIAAALVLRGIAEAEDLETALDAFTADLTALDAQTATALEGAGDVQIIATHPRYEYFARRYGLNIASLEWDAGAMPTDAELDGLAAMAADTGATVLIWEATPPAEAFAATEGLGLANVVFDPLAFNSDAGSYVDAVGRAVDDLANALN
ncbi:metal ABC transporter substrate-binding protein [Pseudooctadecabacter jejudonensis]|uniref:High-affinity zinc uptake system protein ZnuA n=1 Tax=Pseudooctadecabacter jejudonensis TaxID=1391910 RepID=A0A1Y5SI59_9RHOB|nr:metal ABC transporter substrate-binding protein [Pseudooctadecabacter jejudonensis]SLN40677.1 High-affinity zinc uptake system binding-protein ZnuA precursor [Pseudooctadecabacter jejudonensis]